MKKTALLLSVMLLLSVCLCGCGETAYTPTLFTANGERWSIGFSSAVIEIPEDPETPLYIAGYMSGEEYTDILDRQCANAVWIGCSDVNGTNDSGGMLLIGVDCVGLGSDTIDRIRDGLSEFASEVNCSAIAVYATHTHAGIDTLGLWGPYAQEGKNTEFVDNVITAAVAAGKAAYEDRSAGTLYYGQTEAENLQYDSRDPLVYDEYMHQLRFEPDDGVYNGIRLVFFAAHAESLRGDNHLISRDFPGIMADEIKTTCGDDMLFIPGAIGGLIMTPEILDKSLDDGTDEYHIENCRLTGQLLARMLLVIPTITETEVPPMLSYAECDFDVPLDNTAFLLMKFLGILGNESARGTDSETGYYLTSRCAALRFGDSITAALIPGEIFPELVYEDTDFVSAAAGYVLTEETFPSLSRLAEQYGCGTLLVGGLCNDELGYILPPRDFLVHPDLPYLEKIEDESGENHYEETNSAGIRTAQVLFAAMEKVFAAMSASK